MKKRIFFLLLFAAAWLAAGLSLAAPDAAPGDCAQFARKEMRDTCENARRHGLSLNAAALTERLAERAYAAEFCNAPLDPSEERHRDSLLAGGGNFRALYDAHLKRLREMCIYDPDGWCRDRGFERR
ncbi:MAG: hypothetical protein J5838_05415 [Desulfovibrio sp.]|nr:hypothetical protein [Desulfovibrio sp.]